jgi:shikimate dehydrogenase
VLPGSVSPGARPIDARTTVVGVIGTPVRHSLSPLLHNTAFDALGLNWVSLAFEVLPGRVGAALGGLRALGIAGLSVTMPHKSDAAVAVDHCSAVAARLGAVNCVVNRDGTLWGENTDGAGFLESLARAAAFDPVGKRCLVAGAGGAARAVVLALAGAGAVEVAVVNRTADRAADVAALAGAAGRVAGADDDEVVAGADLVVNATPLGMAGPGVGDGSRAADGWPVEPRLLHQGQVVADLVYVPRPTPWLQAAAAVGATPVDGLGMLVHQAAAQLELWTGLAPPTDAMWQAAESVAAAAKAGLP